MLLVKDKELNEASKIAPDGQAASISYTNQKLNFPFVGVYAILIGGNTLNENIPFAFEEGSVAIRFAVLKFSSSRV